MTAAQPGAEGVQGEACCDHSGADEHGCWDCRNTGHTHDPAEPCNPPRATVSVRRAAEAIAQRYAYDETAARDALAAGLDIEMVAATIWSASRADEGTISATGAKHVAAALRAAILGGAA